MSSEEEIELEFVETDASLNSKDVRKSLEDARKTAENVKKTAERLLALTRAQKMGIALGGIMFLLGLLSTVISGLILTNYGFFQYFITYYGFFVAIFLAISILSIVGGIILMLK